MTDGAAAAQPLRPAARQEAAADPEAAARGAAAAAADRRGRAGRRTRSGAARPARAVRRRRGRSGSRSASAAASIWWRRRAAHPEVGLIGCEPFVNGVAMALGAIERPASSNVRLHPGDARDLIELLPAGVLGRVFLLYPDPWPKARHRAAAVRQPGEPRAAGAGGDGAGRRAAARDRHRRLCRACAWPRRRRARGGGWRRTAGEPWADWPGTRYEAKALAAGRAAVPDRRAA